MWRFFSVAFVFLLCSLGIYAEGQDVQQVVVAVEEAGMLPDKVGTAKNVIKNLKVVGDLNGKDIRFLREMAGVAFNGDEIETGSLVDLDLSEANIVEGSEYYLSITSWDGTVTNFSTIKNELSNGMFQSSRLENIALPNSVVKIGRAALALCKSLQTVTIGSSTEGIENYAFMNCTSLEKITLLATTPPVYVPVGWGMQVFDGIDLNKCKLHVPTESIDAYCESSFWNGFRIYDPSIIPEEKLVTIELNGAGTLSTTSEDTMFRLTQLKIKGDINGTDICYLNKVVSSPKAKLILLDLSEANIVEGGSSYYTSDSGTEYFVKPNVIGDYMFYGSKAETIILPDNIISIGDYAFSSSYISSVKIPDTVENIGWAAFQNCKKITEVSVGANVSVIEGAAFLNCSSLKSVKLPEGLLSIGDYAFSECALENITIPKTVCVFGKTAFRWNPLLEIVVPNSIAKIDDEVFDRCKSLSSVTIGNAVESIGKHAFWYCTNLKEFISLTSTPPVVVEDENGATFADVDLSKATLYVPQGSKEKYEQAAVWNTFGKIVEINPTNIAGVENGISNMIISRYSVNGQRLATPAKGINIVKYSDGSVRKEMVK